MIERCSKRLNVNDKKFKPSKLIPDVLIKCKFRKSGKGKKNQ